MQALMGFSHTQTQESSDKITTVSVRKKINNAYFAKFQVVFPLQIVLKVL